MIRTVNNAMTQRRAELKNGENDKGFTLIELMVVIIIIGILAAIAIPVFLNQRQSAWDSSVKSDLGNAAIAAAAFATDNSGSYVGLTTAKLATYGYVATPNNSITVLGTPGVSTYVLIGNNSSSSNWFRVDNGTLSNTPSTTKPTS